MKSKEIEILRNTIELLGPNSYCGPWLSDQMPSIESALANDFSPDVYAFSIHESRIHCEKIIADAKREAAEIEARAKREAEKTREAACRFNESIRADLRRSIESALARIDA